MKAIFDALNIIYDEEEKRSLIRLNRVSLFFTICAQSAENVEQLRDAGAHLEFSWRFPSRSGADTASALVVLAARGREHERHVWPSSSYLQPGCETVSPTTKLHTVSSSVSPNSLD
jgi:hypothetical protein